MSLRRLRQSMKTAMPRRPATAIDPTEIPAAAPAVRPPSLGFPDGDDVGGAVVGALVPVVVGLETVEVAVLVGAVVAEEEDELKPGRRLWFTLQRARRPVV